MLDTETQGEILFRYFSQKHGVRRIARDLGINRDSVRTVVARRSVCLQRKEAERGSILDEYKPALTEMLQADHTIPSTVLLQKLRDLGYSGGYSILKEWAREHRATLTGKASVSNAFLSLDFAPGDTAQVDWGEFGEVFGDGIKIHCFVMVLCYSRLLYIEFTRSEKFEDFLRCHEHALAYFGGTVDRFWYDNLPAAVTERIGRLVRFNARFFAYLGHHRVSPHACNVGAGNEKGRVEDGVKHVRNNFWPGRHFVDFDDLRRQSDDWLNTIANVREHRTTKRIPRLVFDAEEKAKLKPCNPEPYDTDEVFTKEVPPQFRLAYQTNQYSVPWTLVGQVVTIRVSDAKVRIFYHDKQVASHVRLYTKNGLACNPEHEAGLREIKSGAAASESWQVATLRSYGKAINRYLDCLKGGSRSLRYEMRKLLALGTVYGHDALDAMVATFIERGIIGADHIEIAMKRTCRTEAKPAPMAFADQRLDRVPPTVDLRRYDSLLFSGDAPSGDTADFVKTPDDGVHDP